MITEEIDKRIYEAQKKLEWLINGYFRHCIPAKWWSNVTVEWIVEHYNVEMEYFRPWIKKENQVTL